MHGAGIEERQYAQGRAQDRAQKYISCTTPYMIMRENDLAENNPKKSQRRKWIRYERTYLNSIWHADYKQLHDGRWLLCYKDGASRFVTGYGAFDHATTENAIAVPERAIEDHGKPAAILTDRSSQLYATESEAKKKGVSGFEKRLCSRIYTTYLHG